MNRFASAAFLAFGLLAHAGAARGASLTLKIENVSVRGGILRVGVYTKALYPDDASAPIASADVPCQGGENTILLKDVPPGTYAIEVYEDINANDKMDMNWMGLPQEPFGFSRDARPYFGKPGFDRVKIEISEGENVQTIHLQHF